jgi:hypothetical protein
LSLNTGAVIDAALLGAAMGDLTTAYNDAAGREAAGFEVKGEHS